MNDGELSESMNDWPSDSFELLGVKPGTDEKEIKRAYNRIIRRFKPEHFPDQFRRIRAAYEDCINRTSWYRFEPQTTEESSTEPIETPVIQPPPPPVKSDVDLSWKKAVDGDMAGAYRELVQLSVVHRDREDVSLRLYWLLKIQPDLDSTRTRHDWLARALEQSRLEGTSVELYRRELELYPDAAFGPPYHALLQIQTSSYALTSIADARIVAACKHSNFAIVSQTLAECKIRLIELGDAAWLGILSNTLSWVIWHETAKLDVFIQDELQKLKHLELSHSHSFDRCDETIATRDAMGKLLQFHWIRSFFQSTWPTHGYPDHQCIQEVCRSILASVKFDGPTSIEEFGDSPILKYIETVLLRYIARREAHAEPGNVDHTLALIRLKLGHEPGYQRARTILMELMREHALLPAEIIAACSVEHRTIIRDYAARMSSDAGMRLKCLASYILNN